MNICGGFVSSWGVHSVFKKPRGFDPCFVPIVGQKKPPNMMDQCGPPKRYLSWFQTPNIDHTHRIHVCFHGRLMRHHEW